jgi:hypothetical protein
MGEGDTDARRSLSFARNWNGRGFSTRVGRADLQRFTALQLPNRDRLRLCRRRNVPFRQKVIRLIYCSIMQEWWTPSRSVEARAPGQSLPREKWKIGSRKARTLQRS